MPIHYLYKITNLINGKLYIGQTVEPGPRWRKHKSDAKRRPHLVIHDAINKYGHQNFIFETIACCRNQEDANEYEIYFIQQLNTLAIDGYGYNVSKGGLARIGWHHTDAAKQKISQAHQGREAWNKGIPMTPEQIKVNSESHKGLMAGNKHPLFGKVCPDYIKDAVRNANLGNKYWEGRHHTEETKEKLRQLNLGKGQERLPCKQEGCLSISLNLNSQLCRKHYKQWRKSKGLSI